MRSLLRDSSLSTLAAGFIAVLVGYTSSIAIVFQAARSLGADAAQVSSWMWALGIGMGVCAFGASMWLRKPVMIAWSTPGAAVLATAGAAGGFTMPEAIGAFMVSAALIVLFGATGWFERLMDRIPMPIANALLAGVLARFGLDAFIAAKSAFGLVMAMLLAYLAGRRWWPRYAVPVVLAVGTVWAGMHGQLHPEGIHFGLTMPVSRLITMTGVATLVLAPFGAYAINLAAITAAICMGREAHEDPQRRYAAAATAGVLYIVVGLFGAAVAGVLLAFPKELVAAIAGLALLGSIGAGLSGAMKDDAHREAALITFLVTLSGLSLWGIGSAFWGVVAGALALFVQQWRPRSTA
jgi:benzoate membrane transport protein